MYVLCGIFIFFLSKEYKIDQSKGEQIYVLVLLAELPEIHPDIAFYFFEVVLE